MAVYENLALPRVLWCQINQCTLIFGWNWLFRSTVIQCCQELLPHRPYGDSTWSQQYDYNDTFVLEAPFLGHILYVWSAGSIGKSSCFTCIRLSSFWAPTRVRSLTTSRSCFAWLTNPRAKSCAVLSGSICGRHQHDSVDIWVHSTIGSIVVAHSCFVSAIILSTRNWFGAIKLLKSSTGVRIILMRTSAYYNNI